MNIHINPSLIEAGEGYLTEAEAINIAFTDPQIISWLEINNFVGIEYLDHNSIDGYWEISILTTNNENDTLVNVVILDVNREVISVVFLDNPIVENDRIRMRYSLQNIEIEALEYFHSLPAVQQFLTNNFVFSLDYFRENKFVVHGYNTSRWSSFQIYAFIGFNITSTGIPQFHTIKITTNFEFGDNELTISEVEEILLNNSIAQQFVSDYPNYDLEITPTQYFKSPYHSYNDDYGYEIGYKYTEDVVVEYLENLYISIHGGSYGIPLNKRSEGANIIFTPATRLDIYLDSSNSDFLNIQGYYYPIEYKKRILDVVFKDEMIASWLHNISWFEADLNFYNQEVMTLSVNGLISSDYGEFTINTTSQSILKQKIVKSIPPQSTEDLIHQTAILHPEIEEFFSQNEVVNHTALYNTNGTWIFDFYNPLISQNTARIFVNDTSKIVTEVVISNSNIQPNLKIQDIVDLVLSTEFYIQFDIFRDSKLVFYYNIERYWTVYLYSKLFPDNYYRILIDDESASVFRESLIYAGMGNQTSFNEAAATFDESPELKAFRTKFPNSYEILYFHKEWTLYTETLESEMVLTKLMISIDDNLNFTHIESSSLSLGSKLVTPNISFWHGSDDSFHSVLKNLNEKSANIVSEYGYEQLDKLYSFRMIDLVDDDYFDFGLTFEKVSDENSNFLSIAGLVIATVVVTIILVKYKSKSAI